MCRVDDDFISIEGIGEIMADSLVDFFSNDMNRSLLESMENLGVILNGNGGNQVPQSLSGMTFVLTGSLEKFSRQDATLQIEEFGGRVSSSVSKKTNYLIAGPGAGSKLSKAESLSIPVMNEDEFLSFLEEARP